MNLIPSIRPSVVGKLNERSVLRVIQAQGPMSRADVVRQCDLSAPTVSKAVASLLVSGLLEEIAAPLAARGRPAPILRLATERVQVLGVVIDAGHCTVLSAGFDGALRTDSTVSLSTPDTYAELLNSLETACRNAMAKPGVTTLGLGVTLPGLLDYQRGCGVLSPNVPITNGHTPALDLEQRLGVEAVLLQESHALCIAERQYGLAVGLNDFAMMDVGAGVGLGVMSGGRILKGHSGLAGEIGHITAVMENGRLCGCGNTGCLETVCSDAALAARVSQRIGRTLSVDGVVEYAQSSPGAITQELHETARYLAVGVAAVINLFNPSTVFIHSRLFAAEPKFFDRIVEYTEKRALPPSFAQCRIVPAKGNKPQGAIAGIIQHLTNAVVPGLEHV